MKKKVRLASLVLCIAVAMSTIGVFAGSQSRTLGSTMNPNWADITLTVSNSSATANMHVYGTNAANADRAVRVSGYNAFGEARVQDGTTYAHVAPSSGNAFVRGTANFWLNDLGDTLRATA